MFSQPRQCERGSAPRVAFVQGRAGGDEILKHNGVAHRRSDAQRSDAGGGCVRVGADLNAKGLNSGVTPLLMAAGGGHILTARALIAAGAGMNQRPDRVSMPPARRRM